MLRVLHSLLWLTVIGFVFGTFGCQEKPYESRDRVFVVNDHFPMTKLKRDRRVWIYLPRSYDQGDLSYPVLYMQDGQNLFDADSAAMDVEWKVDEHMRYLEVEGHEIIVVGIENGGKERINEYSPWKSQKFGGGHADDYMDFMINDLKPYIDKNYRTKPDPATTGVMGSSMGGLLSHYAVFKHSDVFGIGGVFSPPFGLYPESFEFTFTDDMPRDVRLYYLAGQVESEWIKTDMQKMCDGLAIRTYTHEDYKCIVRIKGKHHEKFWSKEFPHAIRWMFPSTK